MGAPRSVAHRIRFGLQPDVGVTVTRSSLPDEPTRTWLRRLEVHVRLQRFESTPPPAQALSSFEFSDGLTAVLRRWNAGGTLGRNDAFALIAPTELLTPSVVLGLDRAFSWTGAAEEQSFKPWDVADLVALARGEEEALRARAKQRPDALRRSLAQLFDARDRPLTVVGCPDDGRIPLVWALHRFGARYLQQNDGLRRAWTFSTYEVEHGDAIPNQPAVVFLPERPAGPPTSRRLVDVRTDQNASVASATVAQSWVDLFLDDVDLNEDFAQPARLRTRTREQAAEAPVRYHEIEPANRPRGALDLAAAAPVPAGPDGPDYEQPIYHPAERGAEPPAWASAGGDARAPDLGAAVDALMSADEGVQFAFQFDRLRQMVDSPQRRHDLRAVVAPADHARLSGLIVRFVRPERQAERFEQLRAAAFGPDGADLRDDAVLAFATQVLRSGVAAPFAVGLVHDVDGVRGPDVVAGTLADLWRVEHGLPPAPADPAAPGAMTPAAAGGADGFFGRYGAAVRSWSPLRRREEAPPGTSRSRTGPTALTWGIVSAVAFVLVGLVLVVLVTSGSDDGEGSGVPSSAAAPPAGPAAPAASRPVATASGSAAPTTTPTSAGGSVAGTVIGRDLVVRAPRSAADGDDVALVLRPAATETYIYQGPCAAVGDEWVCRELGVALPPAPSGGYEIVLVRRPRINTAPTAVLPSRAATVDTVDGTDVVYRDEVAS